MLASGSECNIELWNTDTGSLVKTLKFVPDFDCTVFSAAFNRFGLLAAGYSDLTVKLWKTDTGELLKTLTGHTSWINSVAFYQNGFLASGSWDKSIRLWNTNTGALLMTLTGHVKSVVHFGMLDRPSC